MYIPEHCPNPQCNNYQAAPRTRWYRKLGHYPTLTFGSVPRFKCKACHTGFSKQTFSINYYAKKELDYRYIIRQINACAGIRNIAHDLRVKPEAVTNRINRLARNAVLANQSIVDLLPFNEDLVLDGLENFCVSQYFPDNYTIMVGKDSQFVYDCDYTTLRRKGRMRPDQKRKRALLELIFKASAKNVESSFRRLLCSLSERQPERELPLILYTDEKSDYERVLWNTGDFKEQVYSGRWRHHKTNSKEGRNTQNPLFPVNYIDREIRKDMASQTRETVQFPRNVSNAMLRMNLYLFDHNTRKPYRINNPAKRKLRHAQVAGLGRPDLDRITEGFFEKRFFRKRGQHLSESAMKTLQRQWVTPLREKPERQWKYLDV